MYSRLIESIQNAIHSIFSIEPIKRYVSLWSRILPKSSRRIASSPSLVPTPIQVTNPVKFRELKAACLVFKPRFAGRLSSFASLHTSLHHLPKNSLQSIVMTRSMASCRPLSVIEKEALSKSTILPSMVTTLKAQFEGSKKESTSVLLGGLNSGEFVGQTPRQFYDSLDAHQVTLNERIEDIKRFCKRLDYLGIDASLAFVDGKVAIKSDPITMKETIAPLLNKTVPWNDTFMVETSKVEADLPTPSNVEYYQSEASNSVINLPVAPSDVNEEMSLRDLFPHLSQHELEAFSSWSEL